MNIKLIKTVTGFIMTAMMMPGCVGYQFGSSLPDDIKTIFVPNFVNQCKEPLIEVEATNATIAEFQRDGTLKISEKDHADVILECTLTQIVLEPLRYDRQDKLTPNEYRLRLHASFVFKRARSHEVLSEESVTGESTFIFTGNLTSAKRGAIPDASEDLAKRIVESVVETWW